MGILRPNFSKMYKYIRLPDKPPTQTSDMNNAASSAVMGPSARVVCCDCNSKKFAFAQVIDQPTEKPIKFAVEIEAFLKKKERFIQIRKWLFGIFLYKRYLDFPENCGEKFSIYTKTNFSF